jgi:hypothetical protein
MKLLITFKEPPQGTPEYEEWLDLNSELIMILGAPGSPVSYNEEDNTFVQDARAWINYINEMLDSTPSALANAKLEAEDLAALDDEDFSEFEEH